MTKRKTSKPISFPDLPQATPAQDWEWFGPLTTKAERRERRAVVLSGRRQAQKQGLEVEIEPRHLYVVEAPNGLIKIGTAFDIELRFDQLQAMSPVPLKLAWWHLHGGQALERWLHRRFRNQRSHGEWFGITVEEVRAAVDYVIEWRKSR